MINLDDFNLDRFLLGEPLYLNTEQFRILDLEFQRVGRQRTYLAILAPGGCGLNSFIERFKFENQGQIFVLNCNAERINSIFADLMHELEFGHRLVNWYDTPIMNIVDALIYYLNEKNNRTLLFFDHCDTLKLSVLKKLFNELTRLKGKTGIIYRLTPDFANKILKSSDHQLRAVLASSERFTIDYPTEDELIAACLLNGIINKSVAKNLVAKTFDYDIITFKVEQLRREVREYRDEQRQKK